MNAKIIIIAPKNLQPIDIIGRKNGKIHPKVSNY